MSSSWLSSEGTGGGESERERERERERIDHPLSGLADSEGVRLFVGCMMQARMHTEAPPSTLPTCWVSLHVILVVCVVFCGGGARFGHHSQLATPL